MHLISGACGHDADQGVAGAHRLDLGSASRDDDFVGVVVDHRIRAAHDDRRAAIDRDDLVAVGGVEHGDRPACRHCLGFGDATALTGADDDDIRLDPADFDVRCRR